MKAFKIDSIAKYLDRPGFTGTFVHTDQVTLAHWIIEKGTLLARHEHPQEQITYVLSGKMGFDTPDGQVVLGPGEGMAFEGGEPHQGTALETSVLLDVFCPVREDFREAMKGK